MKITDLSPPENLTLRLPGEAMDILKSLHAGTKWKLEELAAKIFANFLAEIDLEEMAGSPKSSRGRRSSAPAEANGVATDA